jgi:hypothetical protein
MGRPRRQAQQHEVIAKAPSCEEAKILLAPLGKPVLAGAWQDFVTVL